jgi:hypothetical protein
LAVSFAAALLLSPLVSSGARAYSDDVRKHCRADYMAHCSQHMVGSPEVSACMRNVGPNLQPACINALIKSGEVGGAKSASPQTASAGGSIKPPKGEPLALSKTAPSKTQALKAKQTPKSAPKETAKQDAAVKPGKKAKQVAKAVDAGSASAKAKQLTASKPPKLAKATQLAKANAKTVPGGPLKQTAIPKQTGKKAKQVANASPVQKTVTSKQAAGSKKTNQIKQNQLKQAGQIKQTAAAGLTEARSAKTSLTKATQTKATQTKLGKLATTAKQPQKLKQVVKATGSAPKQSALKKNANASQNAKLKKAVALKSGNKANSESAANN